MTPPVATINRVLAVALCAFLLSAPWVIPLFADSFWVTITTEILIWTLFAASVNLLFGYVGLLSFGQALYFGFGMYGVAIGIAKFGMAFWPAFGFGIFLAVAMAVITGIFAVRLTWHYFAIITLVFSQIFYFVALSWKPVTGGDDGMLFALPPILQLGETEFSLTDQTLQYFFILAVVGLCFYLKHRLLRSPLGKALIAVRENATRASLIGLNVYLLRLTAFVVAGFFAGTAGALFAFFGRYASANYMVYHVSGEGVVWSIVGGIGTLFGPLVGTTLLIILREELSVYWDHYLLLVGLVVILTVIFAPKGLIGLYNELAERWFGKSTHLEPPDKTGAAPDLSVAERADPAAARRGGD